MTNNDILNNDELLKTVSYICCHLGVLEVN